MTTILTYNDIKRMFYAYNYGRSLITFDETYELFEDLNCLNDITKTEFMQLCESHDVNNDKLMSLEETYELYKNILKMKPEW